MTLKRKLLGSQGEDQALEILKNKGLKLVGRNLRLFCGEIDLLMKDKEVFVIVEVKTKSDDSFGQAKEMITAKKKKKLRQLAEALGQKIPQKTIRIDVVAIDENKIEHIISAVEKN